MLTGENGLIQNSIYAKFATEVRTLQEQVKLESIEREGDFSGSINDELKLNSSYNEMLYIKDGEIVYIQSKVNAQQEKYLRELGIKSISDTFVISFETSGGGEIASQTLKAGEKVKRPKDPEKEGTKFLYWYYLKDTGTTGKQDYTEIKFDFSKNIMSDYVLFAKYENEAIITYAPDYNQAPNLFWNYKENIKSIYFKKVDKIEIPSTAVESWEHVELSEQNDQIAAYIENGEIDGKYKLTIISKGTIYVKTLNRYFADFISLEDIKFDNLDTSKTVSMYAMFMNCKSLKTLDLSNFNTRNVINFSWMFSGCNMIENLNLNNFNTESATDMQYVFFQCNSIKELNLSSFNTNNVKSMRSMFHNCTELTNLDISNFNTENVKGMEYMFCGCENLAKIDVSNFNTQNVENMTYMFYKCIKVEKLDVSKFNTSKVTSMQGMFWYNYNIHDLDLSNFDTTNVTNMEEMFNRCGNLKSLNLENFNTNNVTNMKGMFEFCRKLEKIYVGKMWNTDNVIDSSKMFDGDLLLLTGGAGTKWNSTNTNDKNYARIDGGTESPGYFTEWID